MVISHSYVSLPEGTISCYYWWQCIKFRIQKLHHPCWLPGRADYRCQVQFLHVKKLLRDNLWISLWITLCYKSIDADFPRIIIYKPIDVGLVFRIILWIINTSPGPPQKEVAQVGQRRFLLAEHARSSLEVWKPDGFGVRDVPVSGETWYLHT